jgi:hypothetical protein
VWEVVMARYKVDRRAAVVVAGVLIWVGCSTKDGTGTDSADTGTSGIIPTTDPVGPPECANAASEGLGLCLFGAAAVDTVGHFEGWGTVSYGDTRFVADSGEQWTVWMRGADAELARLPDLEGVSVRVVQVRDCHPYAGPNSGVAIESAEGELIAILGAAATDDLLGWSVGGVTDPSTCPARESDLCWEFFHNRPVEITHGASSATAWQGETVEVDGHEVVVWQSESGSGEEYCTDVKGPELEIWGIFPL